MAKNGIEDARKLEISDILCIMRTESGRQFIKRILDYSGCFSDTFDNDPITHARQAGKRNVGLWLYNEIKAAAPEYLEILMRDYIHDRIHPSRDS